MMNRDPHGQQGHLNIYTLDQDSVVTGKGKHARVVACCPDGQEAYCRVDFRHNLRRPSDREIVDVFKAVNTIIPARGRWTVFSRTEWPCGTREDVILKKGKTT